MSNCFTRRKHLPLVVSHKEHCSRPFEWQKRYAPSKNLAFVGNPPVAGLTLPQREDVTKITWDSVPSDFRKQKGPREYEFPNRSLPNPEYKLDTDYRVRFQAPKFTEEQQAFLKKTYSKSLFSLYRRSLGGAPGASPKPYKEASLNFEFLEPPDDPILRYFKKPQRLDLPPLPTSTKKDNVQRILY